jgi:hypothetical protein
MRFLLIKRAAGKVVARLRLSRRFGSFQCVTFPRLFFPAAVLILAAGCAGDQTSRHFTRLRVTDQRGHLIAEWVARGRLHPAEHGYRINAVERLSGPPYAIFTRYPDGWRTTVTGPHILRVKCGEPYWLYEKEAR